MPCKQNTLLVAYTADQRHYRIWVTGTRRGPRISEAEKAVDQAVYLHYYTDTADYFISGYDGEDTMYGTVKSSVFPDGTEHQKISLANLKKNEFMKLDFSWEGQTPRCGV